MHDRKKVKRQELSRAEKDFAAQKIERFRALYDKCFALRDANDRTRGFLEQCGPLLEINPECYSIYAHRRRTFEHLWQTEHPDDAAAAAATKTQDLVAELEHSTRIITKEYKCYAAWVHRHWIMRHLPGPLRLKVLVKENAKLEQLLTIDERNFHAWGYRRHLTRQLAEVGQHDDAQELAFCESKISQNFSNYSAWHNRVLILRKVLDGATDSTGRSALHRAVAYDIDLAVRAFYCDPADQSAWLFAHWVLGSATAAVPGPETDAVLLQVQEAAAELCEEDAPAVAVKWPLFTLAVVLRLRGAALDTPVAVVDHPSLTTRPEILAALAALDPLRRGRYLAGCV